MLPFVYSTVTSVTDTHPITQQTSWDTFSLLLTSPVEVTHKDDIGLWNASAYSSGSHRKKDGIISVHALILDFDNTEEHTDDTGHKTQRRLAVPVSIADVEDRLAGRDYVIATSYSHSAEWPRFRVVLPLVVPVPPDGWAERASALLDTLQLGAFRTALDKVFMQPNSIYYMSSVRPGMTGVFKHNRGTFLSPEIPEGTRTSTPPRKQNSVDDRFSPEQIEKYYRDRVPEFEMQISGDHYRGMCPLHGGEGQLNFSINMSTGLWKCQSRCKTPEGKQLGGDIYGFEMRLFKLEFPEARRRVNALLDIDEDKSVYKPFDAILADIKTANIAAVPEIKKAIAAHGNLRQRQALVKQLIATHQLDPEAVQQEIKGLRTTIKDARKTSNNIVRFPKQNDELASRTSEAQRTTYDQQLADNTSERTANTPFGLFLPPNKYYADLTGVYPVKWVQYEDHGAYEPQMGRPVVSRPMWPVMMGEDVITGETYMHLCWFKSDKHIHTEWLAGSISNNREVLLMLNDVPISIPRVGDVSEYLSVAKSGITKPRRDLATGMGWVRNGTRFITDKDQDITYIGKPIQRRGTATGWAQPLQEIINAGQTGFTVLAVVGLAAAAPLVRLGNKRNPIIGLVSDSSQGKGTALNYALAIWNDPSALVLPAGSTSKGLQDLSIGNSDMPIFADEMQQLKKQDQRKMEEVLYYLGNGQRRVTSTRTQVAKGGERRYGPGFFASETPLLEGAQKGVHYRVVEITGPPLWDIKVVNKIHAATHENTGQVGLLIAQYVNDNIEKLTQLIRSFASATSYNGTGLQGDDAYTVAYVRIGLNILQSVLNIQIDSNAVANWLTNLIMSQRRQTSDAYVVAWEYIMDGIISCIWPGLYQTNVLDEDGSLVAFRFDQAIDSSTSVLEINPATDKITAMLRSVSATEAFARVWVDRGWLIPDGDRTKWIRPTQPSKEGKGIRVWRVSQAGLQAVGRNMKLEPLT